MRFLLILLAVRLLGQPLCAEDAAKKGEEAPPTIITADSMDYDAEMRVATFIGNVVVVDPSVRVQSDRMVVLFDEDKKISRINAEGKVSFRQEDKTTLSDRAVYTPANGEVVLTGNPLVATPNGVVRGEKVTFYRDTQKMIVDRARMEIKGSALNIPELFPKVGNKAKGKP